MTDTVNLMHSKNSKQNTAQINLNIDTINKQGKWFDVEKELQKKAIAYKGDVITIENYYDRVDKLFIKLSTEIVQFGK